MTDEELQAIRARAEAATPGPWSTHAESYGAHHGREWEVSTEDGHGIWTAHTQSVTDAAFIAAARTDVPALLAEVDRLQAALGQAWEAGCRHGYDDLAGAARECGVPFTARPFSLLPNDCLARDRDVAPLRRSP